MNQTTYTYSSPNGQDRCLKRAVEYERWEQESLINADQAESNCNEAEAEKHRKLAKNYNHKKTFYMGLAYSYQKAIINCAKNIVFSNLRHREMRYG